VIVGAAVVMCGGILLMCIEFVVVAFGIVAIVVWVVLMGVGMFVSSVVIAMFRVGFVVVCRWSCCGVLRQCCDCCWACIDVHCYCCDVSWMCCVCLLGVVMIVLACFVWCLFESCWKSGGCFCWVCCDRVVVMCAWICLMCLGVL